MANCTHDKPELERIKSEITSNNKLINRKTEKRIEKKKIKKSYEEMNTRFSNASVMLSSYAQSLQVIGYYMQGVVINDEAFDKGKCFSNAKIMEDTANTFDEAAKNCEARIKEIDSEIEILNQKINKLDQANAKLDADYNTVLNRFCKICSQTPSSSPKSSGSSKSSSRPKSSSTSKSRGSCFVSGTKVLTDNGFINIEDIKIGDKVLSYNYEKSINEFKNVNEVYKRINDNSLYIIKTKDSTIKVTENHMFYIKSDGSDNNFDEKIYKHDEKHTWRKAKELSRGTKLFTKNFKYVKVKETSKCDDKEYVYNLNVEDNNNYFVTEEEILVHNRKVIN